MNLDSSGSPLTEAERKDPLFVFTFDRRPTSSLLTIQLPQDTSGTLGLLPGQEGASGSADKAEAAQAMAMMKMMMKGLFVDVSLNVNGRILKSNATYVNGSRVTLMQIDFDKLLADETGLQKLQAASDVKSLSSVRSCLCAASSRANSSRAACGASVGRRDVISDRATSSSQARTSSVRLRCAPALTPGIAGPQFY